MNKYKNNLLESIKSNKITVGVIGLGYVGLPLALRFAESEIDTIGFDIDPKKIEAIKENKTYIAQYPDELIAKAKPYLQATTDFKKINKVDIIIICVPTPLTKYRDPDLSFILKTMESIGPYLKAGQLLSLESTTYPGTCDEELRPRIEQQGLNVGKDFFLIYSPEREDPGRKDFTTKNTPKVCGGTSKDCLELGIALYEKIIDTIVPVSSTKAAELTKLLENIHRAVNVGLVNEMKMIADKMDLDIFEVIAAAATKPFGFVPYTPGPGLGGHCIPIDPFYLTWKSKEYGINTKFIELAGEINSAMPNYVLQKTIWGLNKQKKSLNGSKVLMVGLSYKKNVDDTRESPSIEIMKMLFESGAEVEYHDHFVPTFPKKRDYYFELKNNELSKDMISKFDCVIIATNHDYIDYKMIQESASLIVDTRGVYDANETIIRA